MENTELQAIEDSKLLKRGTKVIHNGQGYEYFLSDRKWVKRHQIRRVRDERRE